MKHFYSFFVLLSAFVIVLFAVTPSQAQQALDPANYFTVDNAPNLVNGDSASTATYTEIGPWWSGTSTSGWNGNFRQTSQLGGETIAGRSATWITNIPDTMSGNYVLYTYVLQAANNASNVFYTVQREYETTMLDSVRHDQRRSTLNYNTTVGVGAWVPLTIVPLLPGNTFVTVGADTFSGTAIMRADAIRWLRSKATGPDLEFGRRGMSTFNTTRVGEQWLDSPLGTTTYMEVPLFNLGAQDLIVTDVHAMLKTSRWSIVPRNGSFPMIIHPGQKGIVAVGFHPFEEETVSDTLVVESNDPAEPQASIPISGNGVNYNFILNASMSNETHYNAPFDKLGDSRRPTITFFGTWAESGTGLSTFPYPIPSGNMHGTYSFDTAPATGVEYKFQLPDSLNGRQGSSGYYFIEWGWIAFTSNSESNTQVSILPAFTTDTVKASFNQNDTQTGTPKFFVPLVNQPIFLTQGDFTTVDFNRPATPSGGAVIRADLLRIRKIPTGPAIVASLNVNFQNVSAYAFQRQADDNYRLNFIVNSGGESKLVIDSVKFLTGKYYSLANSPAFPLELAAVNGSQLFTIMFTPDTIANGLTDQLRIYSNDTANSPTIVQLSGNGIGTNLTVEEDDPQGAYAYPENPVIYPDLANMNKWQTISDAAASAGSRMIGYVYFLDADPATHTSYVEYYPQLPVPAGSSPYPENFDVYVRVPVGSTNSSPAVRYTIFPTGGGTPIDTVINLNNQASSRVRLGRASFLRADARDSHNGGAIYGYVRVENDTALVSAVYHDTINVAQRDSFVIRADAIFLVEPFTGVEYQVNPTLPEKYDLLQNFPNPFNPTTQIHFALPSSGFVTLQVFDVLGRLVRTLVSANYRAGNFSVSWDGKNSDGHNVTTGVYLYRVTVNNFVSTKKMILLK